MVKDRNTGSDQISPRDQSGNGNGKELQAVKHDDLQDRLLSQAIRDQKMSDSKGNLTRRLTHEVSIRDLPSIVDERGSVCELIDPRWNWHPEPIVFSYLFTLRPGFVKGWGLHKNHDDRYVIVKGEMELVLFDARPNSPTCGEICKIFLSEQRRCIVNIPKFVWHADHNVGSSDCIVVNYPTVQYDHDNPDKYRLPIDTDLIPYKFKGAKGW